jgi:hypothetical protein
MGTGIQTINSTLCLNRLHLTQARLSPGGEPRPWFYRPYVRCSFARPDQVPSFAQVWPKDLQEWLTNPIVLESCIEYRSTSFANLFANHYCNGHERELSVVVCG